MIMEEEINDPELDRLEKLTAAGKTTATDEDDFEEADEDPALEHLQKAKELLLTSATLLEYLGNPDFIKTVTKRERKAIDRQVDRIYDLTNELTETIAELSDEEEEDE